MLGRKITRKGTFLTTRRRKKKTWGEERWICGSELISVMDILVYFVNSVETWQVFWEETPTPWVKIVGWWLRKFFEWRQCKTSFFHPIYICFSSLMRFHESMVLISLSRLSVTFIYTLLFSHRSWGRGGEQKMISRKTVSNQNNKMKKIIQAKRKYECEYQAHKLMPKSSWHCQ